MLFIYLRIIVRHGEATSWTKFWRNWLHLGLTSPYYPRVVCSSGVYSYSGAVLLQYNMNIMILYQDIIFSEVFDFGYYT